MRNLPGIATFCLAGVLALAFGTPLAAAGPDLVSNAFEVRVDNRVVEVQFALALSEVSNYPVTITAMCCSTEEVLYQGTLTEGVYRLTAPLTKISGRGELKVVLKTRITSRSDRGNESFLVYQKWQGQM